MFPKLVVFDLDGTLWAPEMYELWGGGAPFTAVNNGEHLLDCKKVKVQLLGTTRTLLENFTQMSEFKNGTMAIAFASTTDEPEWARECLEKFTLHNGSIKMGSIFSEHEMYKAKDKTVHLTALHHKTGVPFKDIVFFDNKMHNIRDVERLGVVCGHCPDGMTDEVWQAALAAFRKGQPQRISENDADG